MHAIVVHEGGGPDVLKYEEWPDPSPADGQILVRVEAAGINHFDLNQRQDPEASGATTPYVPGLDGAGIREDTGERVLVSGSRGTYAELVAAAGENVRPIPDGLEAARPAGRGVAYKTSGASLPDPGLPQIEI